MRERQILRLLEAGTTQISDMVPVMYKGVHEMLWPAASRSVEAHLIDLARRDLVSREGSQTGWKLR